ncbi:MAG: hypothetical protein ACRC5H_05955, partial [Treponemataceae bacterium]
MFVDTHCHLTMMEQRDINITKLFKQLQDNSFVLLIDIGTLPSDILHREKYNADAKAHNIDLLFTVGIWPSEGAINNRFDQVKELE